VVITNSLTVASRKSSDHRMPREADVFQRPAHSNLVSSGVLQRLYELDNSFALELDKLLHNDEYVGRLLRLPEKELIQLVNYLSDVRFHPVKLIKLIIAS